MPEKHKTSKVYYAFNVKGRKTIAGPFKTRLQATHYSRKVGMMCRFCDGYSGGNTVCRACVCACFENQSRKDKKLNDKIE